MDVTEQIFYEICAFSTALCKERLCWISWNPDKLRCLSHWATNKQADGRTGIHVMNSYIARNPKNSYSWRAEWSGNSQRARNKKKRQIILFVKVQSTAVNQFYGETLKCCHLPSCSFSNMTERHTVLPAMEISWQGHFKHASGIYHTSADSSRRIFVQYTAQIKRRFSSADSSRTIFVQYTTQIKRRFGCIIICLSVCLSAVINTRYNNNSVISTFKFILSNFQ